MLKKSASGKCAREENARLPSPAIRAPRRAYGPRAFISKLSPEITRIFILIRDIVAIRSNVYIAPT